MVIGKKNYTSCVVSKTPHIIRPTRVRITANIYYLILQTKIYKQYRYIFLDKNTHGVGQAGPKKYQVDA